MIRPLDISIDTPTIDLPDTSFVPLDIYEMNLSIPETQKVPSKSLAMAINADAAKEDKLGLIYKYSDQQAKGFMREGMPVFNPYIDMEDAYAKADPFTAGDVLRRMWGEFSNQAFSSFRTLGSGLNELRKGNWSGFWDNAYSKHLADLTEKLHEDIPLYRTKDERENPFSARNWTTTGGIILPALGTVAATVVDIALTHVLATIAGGAVGAAGGPAGAAGGSVAANLAALSKDALSLRNAFSSVFAAAKVLQAGTATGLGTASLTSMANAIKLNTSVKGVTAALFYANGEAALQAELNARKYKDEQEANYYKKYGIYANEAERTRIDQDAKNVGTMTYSLNLPLIAASEFVQLGNFMLGKNSRQIVNKLPIKFVDGKAVAGSTGAIIGGAIGKSMLAEGLEEWGQGVIDDVTKTYYDPVTNYRNNLSKFLDSSMKGVMKNFSQEGALNFVGGALIGGIVGSANLRDAFGENSLRNRAERAAKQFNTTTDLLLSGNIRSEHNNKLIQAALAKGDFSKIDQVLQDEAFNIAAQGVYTGTIDARLEKLEAMKDMSPTEFQQLYPVDFNMQDGTPKKGELRQQDLNQFIDTMIDSIKSAKNSIELVESVYSANPHKEQFWFNNAVKSLHEKFSKDPTNPNDEKKISDKVWQEMKSIIALNLHKYNEADAFIKKFEEGIENAEFTFLYDTNIERAVSKFKTEAKNRSISTPEYSTLIEKIEDLPVLEQYSEILKFVKIDTPVREEAWLTALKNLSAIEVFSKNRQEWTTPKGQKKLLKDIFEYSDYIFSDPSQQVQEVEPEVTSDEFNPEPQNNNIADDTNKANQENNEEPGPKEELSTQNQEENKQEPEDGVEIIKVSKNPKIAKLQQDIVIRLKVAPVWMNYHKKSRSEFNTWLESIIPNINTQSDVYQIVNQDPAFKGKSDVISTLTYALYNNNFIPAFDSFNDSLDPVIRPLYNMQALGLEVDPTNSDYYVDVNGKKYPRVSTLKRRIKPEEARTPEQQANLERAAARGTIIDDMLRFFFINYNQGKKTTLEDIDLLYKEHPDKANTEEFSKKFIIQLFDILNNKLLPIVQENNLTLLTDVPTLRGVLDPKAPLMYAGTVDIIAYDDKGNYYIIDLKTSTVNRRRAYDPEEADVFDYEMNDAVQLMAYQEIIRQITGKKFKTLIFPVQVSKTATQYTQANLTADNGKFTIANSKLEAAKEIVGVDMSEAMLAESTSQLKVKPNKASEQTTKTTQQTGEVKLLSATAIDKIEDSTVSLSLEAQDIDSIKNNLLSALGKLDDPDIDFEIDTMLMGMIGQQLSTDTLKAGLQKIEGLTKEEINKAIQTIGYKDESVQSATKVESLPLIAPEGTLLRVLADYPGSGPVEVYTQRVEPTKAGQFKLLGILSRPDVIDTTIQEYTTRQELLDERLEEVEISTLPAPIRHVFGIPQSETSMSNKERYYNQLLETVPKEEADAIMAMLSNNNNLKIEC